MWITMVVSGLWHGAAWTFIIWGALHAFYISLERFTHWPRYLNRIPLGGLLSIIITNVLVLGGWVFFRAESFGDAVTILSNMFTPGGEGGFVLNNEIRNGMIWLGVSISIELITYFRIKPHLYLPARMHRITDMAYVLLMILACIYLRGEGNVFIYFQF
jgi:alginate O-acetyltransferase complex protein AlgI